MKDAPLVSLVMPNYNYAQYIKAALDSIVSQTFKDFELILIDDASTDESLKVIEPYLQYPFIRFLKNDTNLGFFKTHQRGLELCRGKYVTFPSSDDILFPNFLEKKVAILEQHPDVGLCFSKAATFHNDAPEKIITTSLQDHHSEMKLKEKDLIYEIRTHRLWIPGNATLTRKELFTRHGGYHPEYYSLTDWVVFLKIAFSHGAYFLPETLAALRVHSTSFSHSENLSSKYKAWDNVIKELSQRKNRGLKRAFIKSHIFNTFGSPFYEYILKNPRHWLFFKSHTYKHFYKKLKAQRERASKS